MRPAVAFSILLQATPDHDLSRMLELAHVKGDEALHALALRLRDTDPFTEIGRHGSEKLLFEGAISWVPHFFLKRDFQSLARFKETLFEEGKSRWVENAKALDFFNERVWSALSLSSLSMDQIDQAIELLNPGPPKIPFDLVDSRCIAFSSMLHWLALRRPKILERAFKEMHEDSQEVFAVISAALAGEKAFAAIMGLHPAWKSESKENIQKRQFILANAMDFCSRRDDIRPLREHCIGALWSHFPTQGFDMELFAPHTLCDLDIHAPEEIMEVCFNALVNQRPSRGWEGFSHFSPQDMERWMAQGAPLKQFRTIDGSTLAHLCAGGVMSNMGENLKWIAATDPSWAFIANDEGIRAVDLFDANFTSDQLNKEMFEKAYALQMAASLDFDTAPAPSSSPRPRM